MNLRLSSYRKIQTTLLAFAYVTAFAPLALQAQTNDSNVKSNEIDSSNKGNSKENDEPIILNPYTINEKRAVAWNSQTTFSGSRSAGELLGLSTNISIITSDFIKDLGATNMVEVLRYAGSGVTNRASWRDDFTIRGFRQFPLKDGTPYETLGFFALYDIEKVEIIKGPTALMFNDYGNISGNINYVTKRPTSYMTGDASITVGNYGTYIGAVTQRGPINADKTVRFRVTAAKALNEGWQGHGTDANNFNNNDLVSAGVDWSASPKLELRFDASIKHDDNHSLNYGLLDPATHKAWVGTAEGWGNTTADWTSNKLSDRRAMAEAVYTATPDLTIRAKVTNYVAHFSYNTIDAFDYALDINEAPNYTKLINLTNVNFAFQNIEQTFSYLDATWMKEFDTVKNRLSAGLTYRQLNGGFELYFTDVPNINLSSPISSRSPAPAKADQVLVWDGSDRSGGLTYYVHDTLSLLKERLILSGGLLFVTPSTNGLAKRTTVPNYGIVYRVSPTVSLYGSYAKSYTPRSGKDIFGNTLVDTIGDSKEAGIKFNMFNEHLFGTVTYFDIVNDPVFRQIQGINPNTGLLVFGNAQVGKELNKGWEADIGWVQGIGPGEWSIYATGYGANPKNAKGEQPSSAIKKKYTAFSKYQFKAGPLNGVEAGFGYSYVGDSPGTGFPLMPAYTLCSAFVGYSTGRHHVIVNVENLADRRGVIIGSEAVSYLSIAEPRRIRVTYSRTW